MCFAHIEVVKFHSVQVVHKNSKCSISKRFGYIPDKKETDHVELINSQKDHNGWTSFIHTGSNVCQLVLQYTSFATTVGVKNV